MRGPVGEAHLLEVSHRRFVAAMTAYPLVEQRKFHILDGRLEADEIERLEHEPDHLVAIGRAFALAQVLDELAGQVILPFVIIVEDAQDVEQGRLSRSGSTHDRHEFSLLNLQIDPLQHVERLPVVVSLVDSLEFD